MILILLSIFVSLGFCRRGSSRGRVSLVLVDLVVVRIAQVSVAFFPVDPLPLVWASRASFVCWFTWLIDLRVSFPRGETVSDEASSLPRLTVVRS